MPLRKLLLFFLATFLVLFFSCLDLFHTTFQDTEDAVYYQASDLKAAPAPTDTLVIMTWNIKFAGGRIDFFFDCYGDRTLMKKEEVLANLDGLAAKINQVNPDILFLQEADVQSKRCAYVDNVQYLLDHTDLNYAVYASQWKADYVPSDGIGRANSGNAILSRWKIGSAIRVALPLLTEKDALSKYFYLRRNYLKAIVEIPQKDPLHVLTIHSEAYSHDGTKKKQIDRFYAELAALDSAGTVFVAGGDFNTIPPASAKVKDFPDSKCTEEQFQADDFTEDIDLMVPFYNRFEAETPLSDYTVNNDPYFSHTTDKNGFWNRKLDYLFTNGHFVAGSGLVHQNAAQGGMETMPLSDHAPITVKFILP